MLIQRLIKAIWQPLNPEQKEVKDLKSPSGEISVGLRDASRSVHQDSLYPASLYEAQNLLNKEPFRRLDSLKDNEILNWKVFADNFQKPYIFEMDFNHLNASEKSSVINFALSDLSEKQLTALSKVGEHYHPQDIFKYILENGIEKTKLKLNYIGDYFQKKSIMEESKSKLIDQVLCSQYDEGSVDYFERFTTGCLEEANQRLKKTAVKAIELIISDLEPGESKEFILPLTDPSFTKKHYHAASIIKAEDYSKTNPRVFVLIDDNESRLVNIFTGQISNFGNDKFSLEVNLGDTSIKKHTITSTQGGGVRIERALGFISQVYDGIYFGGRGPLIKTKTKDGEVKNTEYILEKNQYPEKYIEILANLKGMQPKSLE